MGMQPKYMIFARKYQSLSRHARWWNPGKMGYTHFVHEAGLFTWEEAMKIRDDSIGGGAIPILDWNARNLFNLVMLEEESGEQNEAIDLEDGYNLQLVEKFSAYHLREMKLVKGEEND